MAVGWERLEDEQTALCYKEGELSVPVAPIVDRALADRETSKRIFKIVDVLFKGACYEVFGLGRIEVPIAPGT